uniref:Uncharacterized protein n=1 Tax=Meloidogyne enterolobii TaxID=390850 RepID=A0A6V7WIG5_MELEN|nr:unnamed protein product [Meloidogyne enterolobii]
MLKLAGPISTLLCEGFSGSFTPGSDDLKAIKLLHDSVKTEFLSLNQTVGNYFSYMYDYSDWLQRNIVKDCLNPSLLHSRNYVHALNTLDELENKIFVEEDFYKDNLFYKHWKKVTIDRLTHTSLSKSYGRINLLRNHFLEKNNTIDISNVTSAIHLIDTLDNAFIKVVGADFVNDPFKCLLQSFSVGVEKKRESLLNLAKIIMADMTKIAMLGVICSSVEDNKVINDIKIQHLGETINAIARKMHSWIVSELNSAWPAVIKKYAEEEMKKINESNYDYIAKLIQKSANDRGPSSFLHQVIILPPWNDIYFKSVCEEYVCQEIVSTARLYITRYNLLGENGLDLFQRNYNANKWMLKNRNTLKAAMERIVDNWSTTIIGTDDILEAIMTEMESSLGTKLVDTSLYRSIVFVYNSVWLEEKCVIPLGFASNKIENKEAYSIIEYAVNPRPFNAKRFKIIFLI